jgi:hypothetical protein
VLWVFDDTFLLTRVIINDDLIAAYSKDNEILIIMYNSAFLDGEDYEIIFKRTIHTVPITSLAINKNIVYFGDSAGLVTFLHVYPGIGVFDLSIALHNAPVLFTIV